MMKKLLPPQVEGEYYVSFKGLNDDLKYKTYQHQNWYTHKVERISISDFKNIDWKYKVGLKDDWSFCKFMKLQPTRTKTIPIDVDNGGFIKKGTKILVLKKYMMEAKSIYDEFCSLTKSTSSDDFDVETWSNDDDTQVNSNIKGYMEQLHAMLESDEFPALDYSETVTNGSAQGFAVADASTSKTSGECSEYSRRKQEKKKPRNNWQSKGRQSQKGRRNNVRSTRAVQGGSESSSISQKSWSEVVSDEQRAVTAPDTQQHPSNANNAKSDNNMDELKSMIRTLLTNSEIA
jgi:hypothetical protein